MADDKSDVGARDRAEVAAGQRYEVADFARSHGITQTEAKALIERVGNDRDKLEAALAEGKGARRRSAPRKTSSATAGKPSGRAVSAGKAPARSAKPAARRSSPRGSQAAPAGGISATAAKVQKAAKQAGTTIADVAAPIAERARTTAAAARARVAGVGDSIGKTTRRTGQTVQKRGKDIASGAKGIATSRGAKIAGIAAAGVAVGLVANLGRKAMVQAPTALAGDWLEGLKAEHRAALSLFDLLEKTADSAATKRSTLLAQLKHALGKHAFTEENVIYPALRKQGEAAEADKLNGEHGYVKQYLFELEDMAKDDPGFLAKLAEFRSHLEAHIVEEENVVLPPLRAGLSQQQNAKLTALANKEGLKLA